MKKPSFLPLALLGLFAVSSAAAQTRDSLAAASVETIAAETRALAAEVETLKSRQSTSDKILSHLPSISGYIQVGYQWTDDSSSFFIKRARLDFKGDISRTIDYRLQLELASPKIVDAFVRYKPLTQLNVQVGQFKVPFTIENTDYPPLKLEFIEYPMVVQRMAGFKDVCGVSATGRDMGAQLYGGFIKRNGYSILNYNFGVFNGEGINCTDANKSKDIVARLIVQPIKPLIISGYYYRGELGSQYLERSRYGGGACYDDGCWVVRGEYIAGTTGSTAGASFDSDGYYVMTGWWATPHWMPAVRFESFDEVSGVKASRQTNYTAGVVYQPFKHLRCLLNYTYEQYGGASHDRNVVSVMFNGIF